MTLALLQELLIALMAADTPPEQIVKQNDFLAPAQHSQK